MLLNGLVGFGYRLSANFVVWIFSNLNNKYVWIFSNLDNKYERVSMGPTCPVGGWTTQNLFPSHINFLTIAAQITINLDRILPEILILLLFPSWHLFYGKLPPFAFPFIISQIHEGKEFIFYMDLM